VQRYLVFLEGTQLGTVFVGALTQSLSVARLVNFVIGDPRNQNQCQCALHDLANFWLQMNARNNIASKSARLTLKSKLKLL
jgi:hypothetical protein